MDTPIQYANVLLKPVDSINGKIEFAITNKDGLFFSQIRINKTYKLSISYLGYSEYVKMVNESKDSFSKIILSSTNETLETIIITKKLAVKIQGDTTTFRVDQFTNKKERKLRDVLNKLPGIDVDRKGNVEVNGKPVDKFLVDGKDFFNGDEKLGVNNIPADVIDEIEAIDNFAEIALLKNFAESNILALNIKLKKNKKRFYFGDLKAGTDFDENYLAQGNLFYYSPRTGINVITDANNYGDDALSAEDYLAFVNDGSLFNSQKPLDFENFYYKLLNNNQFFSSKNRLLAGNLSQQIGDKTSVNAYTINSLLDRGFKENQNISYESVDNVNESRRSDSYQDFFISNSAVNLKYKNPKTEVLSYFSISYNDLVNSSNILSQSNTLENVDNVSDNKSVNIRETFSITNKLKNQDVFTIELDGQINKSNDFDNIISNSNIYPEIVPVMEQSEIQVSSLRNYEFNKLILHSKYYKIINKNSHLYPYLSFDASESDYFTNDLQFLADESIVDFSVSDFNNDIGVEKYILTSGLEFKKRLRSWLFLAGIEAKRFDWRLSPEQTSSISKLETIILPSLTIDYKVRRSRFRFKYNRQSKLEDSQKFANKFVLATFNQIYQGSLDIDNNIIDKFSLNYLTSNLEKGTSFNFYSSLIKTLKVNVNDVIINNNDLINSIKTRQQSDLYFNNGIFYNTYWKKLKLKFFGGYNLYDYRRFINSEQINYKQNTLSYGININLTKGSNWDVYYKFEGKHQELSSNISKNNFKTYKSDLVVSYSIRDGIILELSQNDFWLNQSDDIQKYSNSNAKIDFSFNNSPWRFGFTVNNIFNNRFVSSTAIAAFSVTENQTLLLPSQFMLSCEYKI